MSRKTIWVSDEHGWDGRVVEDEKPQDAGYSEYCLSSDAEKAERERDRFKEEHLQACELVAKMHAAAVGAVTGPNRGVVEDVEDLRRSRDGWEASCRVAEGNRVDREADITILRVALGAAVRFAKMVRQHAAQHAGHHASSDITTVDIRQEYEFYQEALDAALKAEGKAEGKLWAILGDTGREGERAGGEEI